MSVYLWKDGDLMIYLSILFTLTAFVISKYYPELHVVISAGYDALILVDRTVDSILSLATFNDSERVQSVSKYLKIIRAALDNAGYESVKFSDTELTKIVKHNIKSRDRVSISDGIISLNAKF